MDILTETVKEVVNEKKLSIMQKYGHILIIIALSVVIVLMHTENRELNKKLLDRADDQLKSEQAKNKDLMEINRLSRELEQQARILNGQTDNRFSNHKSVK